MDQSTYESAEYWRGVCARLEAENATLKILNAELDKERLEGLELYRGCIEKYALAVAAKARAHFGLKGEKEGVYISSDIGRFPTDIANQDGDPSLKN